MEKLARLGIHTPADFLFHLPLRYQDRTRVTPIGAIRPGADVVIVAQIETANIQFGRRRSLLAHVSDDTGSLTLRFFHFNQSQQRAFEPGHWIQCFGEARQGPRHIEMVHPEYRISREQPIASTEDSLTPVYPATEGVGPNLIRKLVVQVFDRSLSDLKELLPDEIRQQYQFSSLTDALHLVHHPQPDTNTDALMSGLHPAQQRLATEELLAHHLALSELRLHRQQLKAPAMDGHSETWKQLLPQLEFALTQAQVRVIAEVLADLKSNKPSLRMVQGDVGSGKTMVAAAAAFHGIDAGYQVALMAPTELLAEQHRKSFSKWCHSFEIEVAWLSGKMPAAARRHALQQIESGTAKLIIGTHALFQQSVHFSNLGLIIVDEQHRFGVDQRLALRNKASEGNNSGQVPHQLIMSATPIPRTLAMVFYADLDVSSIDELPPGRKAVDTIVLSNHRRDEIVSRIHTVCRSGQQVYWVCPLIEESENLQAEAATDTWHALQSVLPDLNIELIHGKLKPKEKEDIMLRFRNGETKVLVATTVIEVGVDVPNANLMIIENAERLGLAQLHQLRGRVGRGANAAHCVLLYKPPLGRLAKDRLHLMRTCNDGFQIAQKDLEQRGPGEMLGTRQTGLQQLRIANLSRDADLLPMVEQIAVKLRQRYPQCIAPIIQRWIKDKDIYANV